MKKTTISSEAFLIEIEVQGEVFRVLWGVVSTDETGRWHPGDYVCTTPIQKIEELGGGVTQFHTRSGRLYETTCPVQPHKAKSATEFRFFMSGISPDELEFVRCLEEQNQRKTPLKKALTNEVNFAKDCGGEDIEATDRNMLTNKE